MGIPILKAVQDTQNFNACCKSALRNPTSSPPRWYTIDPALLVQTLDHRQMCLGA